ncbi:CgeB family protein [Terriglobus sp.]|uniref:CgeB family protein n=1 Tax=Terriglobus sp. TaxID=1889013 RepID=UPI003B0096DA
MSGWNIVIFGLTVSSSWGNGHATLWRGLLRALGDRGHRITFFEKDVQYYRDARDLTDLPGGGALRLYQDLASIRVEAQRALDDADVAIVTSYCPDGSAVAEMLLASKAGIKVFYDLDTPVTLRSLATGAHPEYLPSNGLAGFDLVLSYTGGRALTELQQRLGARNVAPLYGWVDPVQHHPVPAQDHYRCDLSYLGTYAPDRQPALDRLFLEPARTLPGCTFLIGGAQYPADFPWTSNLYFHRHVPPVAHPAFFSSSRWTLNITRQAMAEYGFCPSGRLFEAASCGTPLLSDHWEGLDTFLTPGEQIVLVDTAEDVVHALQLADAERDRIARQARERVLVEHTADARARTLEALLEQARPHAAPVLASAGIR